MSTSKLEFKVNGVCIIRHKGTHEISKQKEGFEKYRAMLLSDGSFIISGEYVKGNLSQIFSVPYQLNNQGGELKWERNATSDLEDSWLDRNMPREVANSTQEGKMFSALLSAYELKRKK